MKLKSTAYLRVSECPRSIFPPYSRTSPPLCIRAPLCLGCFSYNNNILCSAVWLFMHLPGCLCEKLQKASKQWPQCRAKRGSECIGNGGKVAKPQRRRLGPSVCHALDCVIFASCPGPTHKSTCCKHTHKHTPKEQIRTHTYIYSNIYIHIYIYMGEGTP